MPDKTISEIFADHPMKSLETGDFFLAQDVSAGILGAITRENLGAAYGIVVPVAPMATGGAGTYASPWTGWRAPALTAMAAMPGGIGTFYFVTGWYHCSAYFEIPSYCTARGDGYNSVILSNTTIPTHTPSVFRNAGWASSTAATNITIENLRFRHEEVLTGTAGPYSAGVALRRVAYAIVRNCTFEGNMTGLQLEGSTMFDAAHCVGYRNGDTTVRINWSGSDGPGGPSALGGRIDDCLSVDAGSQLGDGSALPTPGGPLGSAFVITQNDVSIGSITCVDARGQAVELGNGLRGLEIGRLEGIVNTAGRSGSMLVANCTGLHIGEFVQRLNAAGLGTLYMQGNGVDQVQSNIVVDSATGYDNNNDTTIRTLVNVSRDVTNVKIGKVAAYGMQALIVGGVIGLTGTQDIDVDSVYANNAPGSGMQVNGGGVNGPFRVGRVHIVNCGRDTTISDPKQRSGVVVSGAGSIVTIDSVRCEDTRSGGSRTQTYGLYNSNATINVGDIELTNNLTGPYTSDGTPHLIARFRGTGSPASVVVASVGSTFMRTDGGSSTTMYIKETGDTNTGWRAV